MKMLFYVGIFIIYIVKDKERKALMYGGFLDTSISS